MTRPAWKRTSKVNRYISYWGLKAIVFPEAGGFNYNVLGLDSGVIWGPDPRLPPAPQPRRPSSSTRARGIGRHLDGRSGRPASMRGTPRRRCRS